MKQLRCPLNRIAETQPEVPALIDSQRTISFSELDELVFLTAIKLKHHGFERHSHIAIVGENSLDYCILVLASLRIGAIVCPINNRWPERAIRDALDKLGCHALVNTSESKDQNFANLEIIDVSELVPSKIEHHLAYGQPTMDLDSPAVMIFTSGSTSEPKAALLSYGNFYFNARGANELIDFKSSHRWLLSLPLYHVGGLGILFRAIVGGGAVVIEDRSTSMVDNINSHDITHLSLVPTQLYRLVNDKTFPNLRSKPIALIGGAPLSESLAKKGAKSGLNVYTTYGLTEMASQVTTGVCTGGRHSGKLLRERELKISDDSEILVRGRTLFMGYVKNDEAVLHLDDDGWFHTGDIGEIDVDGNLCFKGRLDNMLISGGENIYPEEIENRLMQIKGIEKALVVPVNDEEFGQRPAAFVKYRDQNSKSNEKLIEQLSQTLPKFKIPRIYLDWPEEKSAKTLKPNRAEFIALAEKFCRDKSKQTPKVSS